MTPTLAGRIETRLLLLAVVGMPWALTVAPLAQGMTRSQALAMLGVMGLLGIAWEATYHALQQSRRDRDWPSILVLAAVVAEGVVAWPILNFLGVAPPAFSQYAITIGTLWLAMWAMMQGPLRVLAPRWRYHGGRLLRVGIPTNLSPASTPSARVLDWRRRGAEIFLTFGAWVAGLVLVACTTVGVVGGWILWDSGRGESQQTSPGDAAAETAPDSEAADTSAELARRQWIVRPSWNTGKRVQPRSMSVQFLHLETGLVDVALSPSGAMDTPDRSGKAGWYRLGTAPGQIGPAIIIGRMTTDAGRGIFSDLGSLTRGAEIVVARRDSTAVTFTVDRVQRVTSAAFPSEAVYGGTKVPTLRLIGYTERRGHAEGENVIVYATAQTLTVPRTAREQGNGTTERESR